MRDTLMVDREAAARFGINVADIANVESGIGGKPVSTVFLGEKRYDIAVRYSESVRGSPDEIRNLTVTLPSGARIPLSQVARVETATGESTITRDEPPPYNRTSEPAWTPDSSRPSLDKC